MNTTACHFQFSEDNVNTLECFLVYCSVTFFDGYSVVSRFSRSIGVCVDATVVEEICFYLYVLTVSAYSSQCGVRPHVSVIKYTIVGFRNAALKYVVFCYIWCLCLSCVYFLIHLHTNYCCARFLTLKCSNEGE